MEQAGTRSIREAASAVRQAHYLTVFTGAGVSTESGIPPFRGPDGLWSRYNPRYLELSYFHRHPLECWRVIKEIFYDFFAAAEPNQAHRVLARLEERGLLKALITQNIDNLHQQAGSKRVIELHGSSQTLTCTACGKTVPADPCYLDRLPPSCGCGGLLKPGCIFFGEDIPASAWNESLRAIEQTDLLMVIGSTGEVYPAASLPYQAASRGARIVEINPSASSYTRSITDIFIPLAAGAALPEIERLLDG